MTHSKPIIEISALSLAVKQIMASADTADVTPGASLTRKMRALAVAEQVLEVWFEHAEPLARAAQLDMRDFDRAVRVLSRLTAIQQSLSRLQATIKTNLDPDPDSGPQNDPNSGPNSNSQHNDHNSESQVAAQAEVQAAAAQLDAEIAEALAEAIDLQTIAHNKSRAASLQKSGNAAAPGAPSIASIMNNNDLPAPTRMLLAMEHLDAAQARAEQVMSQPAPSHGAHFQNYSAATNFTPYSNDPDNLLIDPNGTQYLPNPIRAARDPWYNASAITRMQNNEKRRAAGEPPPPRKPSNTLRDPQDLNIPKPPRALIPPRLNSYPLYNLDRAILLTSKDLTYLTKVKTPLQPPPSPKTQKTILQNLKTYVSTLDVDLNPNSPFADKPTPQSHSPDP